MSRFSGKCDFYDGFVAIHSDGEDEKILENLKKLNLYVCGKDGRYYLVKSDTIKDIVKYYPYLEGIACYDVETGFNIYLSSSSFIDQEERQHREYKVEDVKKYWRKCKREKKLFDPDECAESLWWSDKDAIRTIAERIDEDGNKAEFDDLHYPLWEYFRKEWFEEMVKVGYSEREAFRWCFNEHFASEETIMKRLGRPLKKED